MPTSTRLRDLVRDIRSARTAAEERLVVNRECALIRDNFREEDGMYRCRNVAKLLYIHMLGYPAHFGQLDCLKLIASSKFTDKRIGYLGAMLLLDEKADIHVLVTNSLKNDLSHTNQYIVSLALCTLGSICSTEMSRDLVTEVEKLIKSTNAYLRKKAILCAFRMSKKVPDLIEMFIPCTRTLLNEKNHGVMVTAVTLITEMCQRSPDTLIYFRREMVPNLVRILKNLIMAGYSPEHDVNGVSDPFLQVKVLKLLRILGHDDHEASDAMNDILAQVATNTDTSKNVGHAILYEIVLTIMGVESEAGLRVLAVNILGRFLLNNDKNIRYVALSTLQQVVQVDYKAVQRHRGTIVDCLLDPDVSIQKRAMELCFVLMNDSNIRGMSKELIGFIKRCDADFKADCCSNLVLAVDRYAPNKRWHVETMLQLLITAGNSVREDVVSSLVSVTSQSPDLHSYAVTRLYSALVHNSGQQALIQVAAWSIGEYGEHLLLAQDFSVADEDGHGDNLACNGATSVATCDTPVPEEELLSTLERPLLASAVSPVTKQMLQVCLMKLSTRLRLDTSIMRIRQLINIHSTSVNVELQQRSVEFSSIFRSHDGLRAGLLETVPPLEMRMAPGSEEALEEARPDGLLDLLGLEEAPAVPNGQSHIGGDLLNLLGDISLNDQFTSSMIDAPLSDHIDHKSSIATVTVYEGNDGIKLTFSFDKISGTQTTITLHAFNNSTKTIDQFLFQAAVPKTFQLTLLAPSSDTLAPSGGSVTQLLKLTNLNKQPWKMKVRLQYRLDGDTRSVQHQLDSFPCDLWT